MAAEIDAGMNTLNELRARYEDFLRGEVRDDETVDGGITCVEMTVQLTFLLILLTFAAFSPCRANNDSYR